MAPARRRRQAGEREKTAMSEREKLEMVKREVARLLERIDALVEIQDAAPERAHWPLPERAAMLRSSLDLTKALARLRKTL